MRISTPESRQFAGWILAMPDEEIRCSVVTKNYIICLSRHSKKLLIFSFV
tara:strand:- start:1013 stop:1162 length:150 start_codon:yes stop_codon:yes gene_type:complete